MEMPQRLREIANKTNGIHGWLDLGPASGLYTLASACRPALCVELGSWKGRSSIWIASALQDRGEGHLYCVDTWEGSALDVPTNISKKNFDELMKGYKPGDLLSEFERNVAGAGVADLITPIVSRSGDAGRAWDHRRKIGLLYIDADHEWDSVLSDFEAWSPHVADGGFIVFDDSNWLGVSKLISKMPGWYSWCYSVHPHTAFKRENVRAGAEMKFEICEEGKA